MEPKQNVKQMELTRETARSMKRQPVRFYSETLGKVMYIKPLKLRRALELLGDVGQGGRPLVENIESVLRLATESIVERDGTVVFEDIDACEESIGHALTEIQDVIMDVQGLGAPTPKKK